MLFNLSIMPFDLKQYFEETDKLYSPFYKKLEEIEALLAANKDKKVYVCYHADDVSDVSVSYCMDGLASATLFNFMNKNKNTEYIPLAHRMKDKWIEKNVKDNSIVVFLDIFVSDIIHEEILRKKNCTVIVLDHHPINVNYSYDLMLLLSNIDIGISGLLLSYVNTKKILTKKIAILMANIALADMWNTDPKYGVLTVTPLKVSLAIREKLALIADVKSSNFISFLEIHITRQYLKTSIPKITQDIDTAWDAFMTLPKKTCTVDKWTFIVVTPSAAITKVMMKLAEFKSKNIPVKHIPLNTHIMFLSQVKVIFNEEGIRSMFPASIRFHGNKEDAKCNEIAKLFGGNGHPVAAGCSIQLDRLKLETC